MAKIVSNTKLESTSSARWFFMLFKKDFASLILAFRSCLGSDLNSCKAVVIAVAEGCNESVVGKLKAAKALPAVINNNNDIKNFNFIS